MASDLFKGDVTERYSATARAGLGDLPSVSGIESAYMDSVNQGAETTAAGLAWNFKEERVDNVIAFLQSGDFAAAKESYDNMREEIRLNHDKFTVMARLDETVGPEAAELGRRSRYAHRGEYNQEEVVLPDGTRTTLGRAMGGDGSHILADTRGSLSAVGVSPEAAELYMANDAVVADLANPLLKAHKSGQPSPTRIQDVNLIQFYTSNKDRLNDVFGEDGTRRFMQSVKDAHASSGCGKETAQALTDYAEVYARNTGTSGWQLATDVVEGYHSLLRSTFRGDPKTDSRGVREVPEISDDQRRQFDAMLLPTLTALTKGTGDAPPVSLTDPRLKQGLLEVADLVAWTGAAGVNLMALGRDESSDMNGAFASYIRDGVLGVTRNTDNLVEGFRRARADLTSRIVGADTASMQAVNYTGQPADYAASVARSNGSVSTNTAADVMASDVQRFILKGIAVPMARGSSYQDALAALVRTGAKDSLAEVLSQSLSGNDRGIAAKALADKILADFAAGGRVNVQDAVAELAMGEASAALPARSRTVLMRWYQGNVPGPLQFGAERSALLESLKADGLNDAEARRTVSAAASMAATFALSGKNPRVVFNSARSVGSMYVPVETETEVPDGRGGKKKVVRTEVQEMIGNRDKAAYTFGGVQVGNGTFSAQPDLWYQSQRLLKQMLERKRKSDQALEDYRRRLELAEEIKD